jgi:hypothetical protein
MFLNEDQKIATSRARLRRRHGYPTKPGTTVWQPGTPPLLPKPWSGRGRKPTRLHPAKTQRPFSVKELAMSLKPSAYRKLTWREGTNTKLSSRFATVRVRAAHRDYPGDTARDEEWLLIECPKERSSQANTFSPRYRQTSPVSNWSPPSRFAGALSVTTRNSNKSSVWTTSKDATGAAFITMPRCASLPTDFSSANVWPVAKTLKKTPPSARRLHYPKVTPRGAPVRPQRHVLYSIPTLRWHVATAIARILKRCPCCGRNSAEKLHE